MKQCVERYKELCGQPDMELRPVDTPSERSDGEGFQPDWGETAGTLAPVAQSVLSKILYGVRFARWDLLKIVSLLATRITRWTLACDKALHRLVAYINSTAHQVLRGYVSDAAGTVRLEVYADADFAGDKTDYKSTSGMFAALVGENTFFPLTARSAKQTAAAHSTLEAELVAASLAMRNFASPALDLWSVLFN